MSPLRGAALVLVLLSVALAGCLGGDDEPAAEQTDQGETEGTGSIAGKVYNLDGLEPIRGATVRLVSPENQEAGNASTNEEGSYTIRNVEPGTYRLQVLAVCCRESVTSITVEPERRAWMNFTLERHAQLRVQTPFVDRDGEWEGFISCALAADDQNPMFPGPCQTDENHNHRRIVFFPPGARTITAQIEWDPAGGELGAEEMRLSISNLNAGLLELGSVEGQSPLELQIQNLDIEDPEKRLDVFDEDGWVARLQVEPISDSLNVVYQQSFRVTYHVHYWQPGDTSYSVEDAGTSAQGDGFDEPLTEDPKHWISMNARQLLSPMTQEGTGPNPYQEGDNSDCLDYQALYNLDGVHSPLAQYVDVEAGTGYVTDSSAGWAHIDFFNSGGDWLGYNAGNPNGNVPDNAEYGIACIGLTAGYPDVPEPFAVWFYMDGFTSF